MFFTHYVVLTTILAALLLALSGCSVEYYRKDADKEVYEIIDEKWKEVGFGTTSFSIEQPNRPLRERILERLTEFDIGGDIEQRLSAVMEDGKDEDSGDRKGSDPGVSPFAPPVLKLTLLQCIEIAAENSREYRTEKETVYLSALTLTLKRHVFGNRYTGSVKGSAGQRSATVGTNVVLSRVLASGTIIVLNIGATLLRVFTGGGDDTNRSLIDLTITQPLLRGAGRAIVLEPLTQAKRNVLYTIRSFERAKKELAVDITRNLYRILQKRDQVKNARTKHERPSCKSMTKWWVYATARGRLPGLSLLKTAALPV
uniref:Uncharacterized protein n=1 Tax=Candidatus Kentrum sp. TC TaxID=2126339 RepID=A0A451AGF7_9GAMM|nr:MAG: hypothetical protein BECKTC1821F_GA0114240_11652 [Candidatus Kentron sp. TC]